MTKTLRFELAIVVDDLVGGEPNSDYILVKSFDFLDTTEEALEEFIQTDDHYGFVEELEENTNAVYGYYSGPDDDNRYTIAYQSDEIHLDKVDDIFNQWREYFIGEGFSISDNLPDRQEDSGPELTFDTISRF